MSDYYAILVNLPNAPKGNAHLDVSIDGTLTAGQPVPVTYDVYRAADGVPLALSEGIPVEAVDERHVAPGWDPHPGRRR